MATFEWDLDAAGAAAGDETTVTSGNAGTDGPTSVSTLPAGGTRAYDDDQAPPDLTWSVRLATGATSGTSNMTWGSTRIPDTSVGYFRIPFRFSSLSANRSIVRIRGGGTQVLRGHHTADARLEMRDSGNSVAATGTVAMPEDTWVEIGVLAVPGAAAECRLRWWQWGAAVEDFEDEVVATDNFSSETTVDELTVGNIAAGSNIAQHWVGPVRYDSAGWPGPLATGVGGTLAVTLPAPAAALTGVVDVPGAAGIALPALTADLGGAVLTAGALAAALPAAALAATGAVSLDGTVAATLQALTAALTADVTVTGTADVTLPGVAAGLHGVIAVPGSLTAVLPALTATLAGSTGVAAQSGSASAAARTAPTAGPGAGQAAAPSAGTHASPAAAAGHRQPATSAVGARTAATMTGR